MFCDVKLREYLICCLYAELASLRQIHTSLTRIFHKYLHKTAVVVCLAKARLELYGARIVVIGLGEVARSSL